MKFCIIPTHAMCHVFNMKDNYVLSLASNQNLP